MSTQTKVAASAVREWAAKKGLAIAGARGRLSKDAISAYNKSHTAKYNGAAK